jgi:hypothetical protein
MKIRGAVVYGKGEELSNIHIYFVPLETARWMRTASG